jgi:hypothetical protein
MKTAIDDLPFVGVSRMRASGEITASSEVATIAFGGLSFNVGVQHVRFPNRGDWAFFVCPCGRRARTLRLLEGAVVCRNCCELRGVRWRVTAMSRRQRAERRIPLLRAMLESKTPLRLNPVLWGAMERRSRLEAALRECEFRVARRGSPRKVEAIDDPCNEPDFVAPKRPWPGSKPGLSDPG